MLKQTYKRYKIPFAYLDEEDRLRVENKRRERRIKKMLKRVKKEQKQEAKQ